MSVISMNSLARKSVEPQFEAALEATSSQVERRPDRFVGIRRPTLNKLICGGLALTALAMLPTAAAHDKCQVDYQRIFATCGAAALQAIMCGAGGLLQCGGTVMATAVCAASVKQGCLDGCIDPRSMWCC